MPIAALPLLLALIASILALRTSPISVFANESAEPVEISQHGPMERPAIRIPHPLDIQATTRTPGANQ
jgi:hypothetical protein